MLCIFYKNISLNKMTERCVNKQQFVVNKQHYKVHHRVND
jgi:hypothetical protein